MRTDPGRTVANRELPDQIPTRPSGDVPVIVRVVWADGREEWRPARAVRWTLTHVMVAWRDDEAGAHGTLVRAPAGLSG